MSHALPCEFISIEGLLVRENAKSAKTHEIREFPDLKLYQVGEKADYGLHFQLRNVTLPLPIERKEKTKQAFATIALAFDSSAYTFLKALDRKVAETIKKYHGLEDKEEDKDFHIGSLFDESQGLMRMMINRPSSRSVPHIPCTKENSKEQIQIFHIKPTDRIHVSVNLQHIWGTRGKTGRSEHRPMCILKSIEVAEDISQGA